MIFQSPALTVFVVPFRLEGCNLRLVRRHFAENQFAEDLDAELVSEIQETCKRIYRLLTIDGYARIDLRLTPANEVYFIEANPNPILAADEDFALSAGKAGLAYPQLIDRIVRQGMKTVRD